MDREPETDKPDSEMTTVSEHTDRPIQSNGQTDRERRTDTRHRPTDPVRRIDTPETDRQTDTWLPGKAKQQSVNTPTDR